MAPYARLEIAVILAVGAIGTVIVGYFLAWWALVPAVVALALLSFYRDPPRRSPSEPNLILAPADGTVVEIARDAKGPSGEPTLRIMIFLSVFDVHINRSPCAGRVRETRYRRGRFINALRAEAGTENEHNVIAIEPASPLPGPITVRQIAGVLARRIVCAVRPGDTLTAGQRVGMIKLGSRTEVSLPEQPGWEVCIAVGQHVKAGLTVLARLRPA